MRRSTLSDILKESDKIWKTDLTNKYRYRNAKYPELEEALYFCFCQKRDRFLPISHQMLIKQAQEFGSPEF